MTTRQPPSAWVERMATTASAFDYPRTPDLAGRMPAADVPGMIAARARGARARRAQRTVLAVGAALLLCVLTLAVPPARAALLALLRIGAVQITLDPTPSPSPASPTPVTPPLRPLGSILDLDGEATLAQARAAVRFPIRLPTHPADLGAPSAAFVQNLGDQAVTLVWLDPAQPRRVKLALQILGPGAFVEKLQPRVITSTQVGRNPAVWAVGEYLLRSRSGDFEARRLISGNTLIWRDGDLTYRLETDLPMAEAVRIAESLRP